MAAAATRRTMVISAPNKGIEISNASKPSSGVAIRNAIAAVAGTPFLIKVRYSGKTPQVQIGNGKPKAIPFNDRLAARPFFIHRIDVEGRNSLINPPKK